MYKTKIDLSEKTRRNVILVLNDRLADAIDLKLQVKQAHWNVKGPHFIALHELFDKVAEEIDEYTDMIAERIMQLGGVAEGTAKAVAEQSALAEARVVKGGMEYVASVASSLAAFAN